MNEHLKFRGRLAEKEFDLKKLELRIRGGVDAVRNLLDPFEAPADLRAAEAAEQAIELASVHAEYVECVAEIRALKRALGVA
jgi:hypothetical protein